jgi:hypothetical protein
MTDTSREAVERICKVELTEIARAVGMPVTREDASAVALTARTLRALLARAEKAEAECEKLRAAITRQSGAAATLRAITLAEVQGLKDADRSEYNAAKTLEGERAANAMLTDEIERLIETCLAAYLEGYGNGQIDAGMTTRGKMVAEIQLDAARSWHGFSVTKDTLTSG